MSSLIQGKGDLIAFVMSVLRSPDQRRHLFRWIVSKRQNYLLKKPMPWMTFDAIDFIANRLQNGCRIFEYGSGGSTLFWLKWKPELVSVEHDSSWHALMAQRIQPGTGVQYRLVPPEKRAAARLGDASDSNLFASSDELYRGFSFETYVRQIEKFPDRYFDLVVVDGRARPSCLRWSAQKVKPGGFLVLDNAEREYYTSRVKECLGNYRVREFRGIGPCNNYFWQTNVYERVAG
ncbi:MAG: hypothetical protein WBD36_00885 [Bacteroidota bacterium]